LLLHSTTSLSRIIVGEPVRTESAWGARTRCSDDSPAPLVAGTLCIGDREQSAEAG
jgi:hypothetical protein